MLHEEFVDVGVLRLHVPDGTRWILPLQETPSRSGGTIAWPGDEGAYAISVAARLIEPDALADADLELCSHAVSIGGLAEARDGPSFLSEVMYGIGVGDSGYGISLTMLAGTPDPPFPPAWTSRELAEFTAEVLGQLLFEGEPVMPCLESEAGREDVVDRLVEVIESKPWHPF